MNQTTRPTLHDVLLWQGAALTLARVAQSLFNLRDLFLLTNGEIARHPRWPDLLEKSQRDADEALQAWREQPGICDLVSDLARQIRTLAGANNAAPREPPGASTGAR